MRAVICILIFYFAFTNLLLAQQKSIWEDIPDNIKSRKYEKRFEWFYRQRSAPFDTISYFTLQKEFKKEKNKNKQNIPAMDVQWMPVGPKGVISYYPSQWGVISGRVRAIDIHPTNPNIVYIGAASGGIWKTTEGGDSWESIADDLGSITFGAIAIDPSNPDIIFAGTGEVFYGLFPYTYYGTGLYKSTDAGVSWNKITNEFGEYTHFGDIVVDPHDDHYIYAALASGNFFLGQPQNKGVWRSTDGGITWEKTLGISDAFDIAVHPTNPNLVYAAIGGATNQSGFYISSDKGETWTRSSNGLPVAGTIGRMQISVSESSQSTIYALIYTNVSTAWKSTDGGNYWVQMSSDNPLGGYYAGYGWFDQGSYDLCIAASPFDPNYILVGNIEFHKCTDGSNFSVSRSGTSGDIWASPMHIDYHKIMFSPSDQNIIYVCSDGGVFKSTDSGNTWSNKNNSISTVQFYSIASHPTDQDKIIGGAQDIGNFRTLNGGETNWELSVVGDGMNSFYDYENPDIVYFSTQRGDLYKSSSGGAFNTSYYISPNYGGDLPFWNAPFFMHPTNHNILYVASAKVWRSTNAGSTWDAITTAFQSSINSMDQNKKFPEIMILSVAGNFSSYPPIMVSTNEGTTWTNVKDNIPGSERFISCVKTDPNYRNTVYAVRSGFGSGKIYKSEDLGMNWTDITGDLPDIPHNDIIIDPRIPGYLYTANDFGVYKTTNGGINWNRLSNGMPIVPVMDLDYVEYPTGRFLRAGTYGRSAYEIELTDTNIVFLTLTKPLGGEIFVEGVTETISWISNNIEEVSIDVSVDNGQSWQTLAPAIAANSFNFNWLVPSTYSDSCLIKITDITDPSNSQISPNWFSIIPLLQPALQSPQNGASSVDNNPAHLVWNNVLGCNFYTVQVSSDSSFLNIVYQDSLITDHEVLTDALENNTQYFWHVKARNNYFATPYSETWHFRTILGTPVQIYPEANSNNIPTAFDFLWEVVQGAELYHLQVSINSYFSSTIVDDSTIIANTFSISGLENNKYYYWRIRASNQTGRSNYSNASRFKTELVNDIKGSNQTIPSEYSISQNYPNPFNPITTIRYGLPESSEVKLIIYDAMGSEIKTYSLNNSMPGYYDITWDGTNNSGTKVSSGIYFLSFIANSNISNKSLYKQTLKMILLK